MKKQEIRKYTAGIQSAHPATPSNIANATANDPQNLEVFDIKYPFNLCELAELHLDIINIANSD